MTDSTETGTRPADGAVRVQPIDIPDSHSEGSLLGADSLAGLVEDFERTAKRITVAGSPSLLLTSGWSDEAEGMMAAGEGGVWCAGAAEFLALQWAGRGTAVVHYGPHPTAGHPEGLLTHAVTLVHVEGEWYALDPYLGIIYPDPIHEVVGQLTSSPVRQLSIPIRRRVIFESDHLDSLQRGGVIWLVGRFDRSEGASTRASRRMRARGTAPSGWMLRT